MVTVRLITDLVSPKVGRRRAERSATLPGVPAAGEYIDTIPGPTLALHVTSVRWQAIDGTVTLFLGAGRPDRPGMTDHEANSNSRTIWSRTCVRRGGTSASTSDAVPGSPDG
jgi:hypothetical protein